MQTVAQPDGSVKARIYQQPAFRKDGDQWKPVNARVRSQRDPAAPVAAPDALHPLRFGARGDDLLDIATDGGSIRLQWPGGAISTPSVEGDDTVIYRDAATATDLRFRSFAGGVRSELWLKSAAAPTTFTFHLSDPDGLLGELRPQEDGSYRSEKRIDEENQLVIQRAIAYSGAAHDGPGPESTVEHVALTVERSGDGWAITKTLDQGWLDGQEYPVVLDPTLSYDTGPRYDGTDECYVASAPYTANSYCESLYSYLKVGSYAYGTSSAYKIRALLRFDDIISIPVTAHINSARVGLHQLGEKPSGSFGYDLYEVTEDWKEANWNERYDNSGIDWATAGGTVASGAKASAAMVKATTATPSYDTYTWFTGAGLTSLVRRWRNTGYDARHGVLVRGKEANSDNRVFVSSRGEPDNVGTPVLEVTYSIPGAGVTAIAGDESVKVLWAPQTVAVTKHVVNVYHVGATVTLQATVDVVCPTRPAGVSVGSCPRYAVVDGLTNGQPYYATIATHATDGVITTVRSNEVVASAAAGMTGREPWWSFDDVIRPEPTATLGVNAANSNVVLQHLDGTPQQGHGRMGYVLRRTYNSHFANDDTLPGSMGAGWTLNVGEVDGDPGGFLGMLVDVPLRTPFTDPSRPVYLMDRDGTRHKFTVRSTTSRQVLKTNINGAPFAAASTGLGTLLPQRLQRGMDEMRSKYNSVCIDRVYEPPPGVELALWRYIAVNSDPADPCVATGTNVPAVIGYATMRTDRVRSEYSFDGRILSTVDGTGTELRYLYTAGVPKVGVVLGNLEAVYEPRSCSVAGAGVVGTEVTLASEIPSGCRAFRFAYDARGMLTTVTDPAGRTTTYTNAFDGDVPQPHLTAVTHADGTLLQYVTSGINHSDDRCGTGYLCTVKDARGQQTTFRYASHSSIPGIQAVHTIGSRDGHQRYYSRAAGTFVRVHEGERREFLLIDSRGRVGRIKDMADATSELFRETDYTWDSTAAQGTCGAPGAHIDNNLCMVVRKQMAGGGGGAPQQKTRYSYNSDGALLSIKEGDDPAPETTTFGYQTQYFGSSNAAQVWTDRVDGNRGVTSADPRTAPGGTSHVYVVVDRTAMLSPRGNAEPSIPATPSACASRADCRAHLTSYTVDNDSADSPNTVVTTGFCGPAAAPGVASANSGLVCEVTGPAYNDKKDSTALHSRTLFRYDQFGQRLTMVTPKAVSASTITGAYQYHYFGDSELDLSGNVSAGGWLRAVTDPDGRFVAFGYDRAGNVIRTWDRRATSRVAGTTVTHYPGSLTAPPSTEYTQVLYGPGTTSGDAVSKPWRYVRSHRDPLGNVTTYCYDENGNPTVSRSPRGTTGSFAAPCPVTAASPGAYDTLYNTLDWNGVFRTTADGKLIHDAQANDQPASIVRPSGHNGTGTHVGQRVVYGNNRPVWIRDELGHVNAITYDAAGRRVRQRWTRQAGTAASSADCLPGDLSTGVTPFPADRILCESTTAYDGLDNVISESDSGGGRTDYSYDHLGRRTAAVMARTGSLNLRHEWRYDGDSNVVAYCPPRQFATGDELAETTADPAPACPADGLFSQYMTYDVANRPVTRTRYRQESGTDRTGTKVALVETMTYDADGNQVTYGDPRANAGASTAYTVRSEYDLQGRLTKQSTPYGSAAGDDYVTAYEYDAAGTLRAETKPGSTTATPRITAYTYDALNRLRDTVEGAATTDASSGVPSSTGGTNIRTRRLYDPDGNLVGVYGPRAFSDTTSLTNPNVAFLTRLDVDADGRTTATYQPRFSSAAPEGITPSAIVPGNTDCKTPSDAAAFAASTVTVPSTMDAVPTYSAANPAVAVCRTRFGYDAKGQLTKYIPASDENDETASAPSPHRVVYRYSDDGLVLELDEPAAHTTNARDVTTMRYDGGGRLRSRTETVRSRTWTWNYALDGTLLTAAQPPSIDLRTHETSYQYNLAGELVKQTNPEGEAATTRHYADGLVAEQADHLGNTLRHAYDRNGNVVRTYSPAAVHSLGNPSTPDPTNMSGTPTSNLYNRANQLTTSVVPTTQDGTQVRRTDYTYDTAGRRIDTTTYLATCALTGTRCEPESVSSLTPVTGQSSGTQSLTYYRNDRVAQRLGRGSTSRPAIGYEYDAAGNVTKITDSTNPDRDVTASYYLDGLVRRVYDGTQSSDYRTDYNYSGDGLIEARRHVRRGAAEDARETTVYVYDPRRLLVHLEDFPRELRPTEETWITYDADGRMIGAADHHFAIVAFEHDNDDTLLSKTVTTAADDQPNLAKWTYKYDKAQRITEQQLVAQSMGDPDDPGGTGPGAHGSVDDRTYKYTYDDGGRLSGFTRGTGPATLIAHDRNGNRTTYGTQTTSYNPDDTIKTTSASAQSHTYYPFGGHKTDHCTTNTYDGFDRLITTDVTGSGTCGQSIDIDYTYDGLDRQRRESGSVNNGTITRNLSADLHYDGLSGALAFEVRATDDWTRYILDPSGETAGTAVAHEVFGTLASTQIDDGTGNLGLVVEHVNNGGAGDSNYVSGCTARLDPYGEPSGRSADGTNICNTGRTDSLRTYRGARRDPATGAYQFGARTYVPGRAGFLTPDNYQAAGTERNLGLSVDPLTRNSYAYVNGDPINLYDPTGHRWRDWKDRAIGIAKQVGGVFKGLGEALYETGKGVGDLAWAGVALTGARGNQARVETWNQVRTTYQAIKSDPWGAGKAIVSSFADGIRSDWKNGNYGEAIGRGLFDALSSLAGGGIAAKLTRLDIAAAGARIGGRLSSSALRGRAGARIDYMDSFTASGSTVEHGKTFTRIGDDEVSARVAKHAAPEKGYHDVVVHSNGSDFLVDNLPTNAAQIAEAILENAHYTAGQPIRLLSCSAACGPAQELANVLGVKVKAASSPVGTVRDGSDGMLFLEGGGKWETFHAEPG